MANAKDLRASRGQLIGLLWSDRLTEQARASLRQCLFALRLAAPGLVGADDTWVWLAGAEFEPSEPEAAAPSLDRLKGIDPAFDSWLATRQQVTPNLRAEGIASRQELVRGLAVISPRRRWGVVGIAIAVPLAAAAPWALRANREVSAVAAPIIAIAPFTAVPDTPAAHAVAEHMADDVRAMLPPDRGIVRLRGDTGDSREVTRRLRAEWVISGSVDDSGDVRSVRARIANADGRLIWTREVFAPHGALADAAAIAATRIGAATSCALRRPQLGNDLAVLGLLFDACDRIDWSADNYNHEQALLALQQLAQAAPDDAFAQAFFGTGLAMTADDMPMTIAKAQRAEAFRRLDRAQRLDPRIGEVWVGRFALVADDRAWALKESLLAHGLAVEPDNVMLNDFMAELLANVGRTEEGLVFAERARAIAPAYLTAA